MTKRAKVRLMHDRRKLCKELSRSASAADKQLVCCNEDLYSTLADGFHRHHHAGYAITTLSRSSICAVITTTLLKLRLLLLLLLLLRALCFCVLVASDRGVADLALEMRKFEKIQTDIPQNLECVTR